MNNKIIIEFDKECLVKENQICFKFNKKTKVRELLIYLIQFVVDAEDYENDNNLIGHFSFENPKGEEQKAQLDYSLKKFLKNFKYNLKKVKMYYYQAFGIGAFCILDDIARIQVNADEPRHNNPHVHIFRINKYSEHYRIDLKSFTQMKGDKENWQNEFSRKERRKILKFLEENQIKLINYYNRCRKGEYIIEDYTLVFNGKKYFFNTNRTY